jgi:hypothetical protein
MSDNNVVTKDDAIVIVPAKKTATEGASITETFDRYQKMVYLIDESGSMSGGMAPEDEKAAYDWTPEVLSKFRNAIRDERAHDLLDEDPALDPREAIDESEASMKEENLLDDDKLIDFIIENRLHHGRTPIKVRMKITARHSESKTEAVRGAMTKFVEQRYEKFPDAQVALLGFGTQTHVKCYAGAPKQEVLLAIQALSNGEGGTDITQAVERGINEFKRRPSMVKAHHLVLVSDGMDYAAGNVRLLLPKMKELNIVFDFIFVKGQHEDDDAPSDVVVTLKQVCEATGGEYNEVSKSTDFEKKFLAVSNRRALPPARY